MDASNDKVASMRELKEEWVTGLTGSELSKIHIVVSTVMISYWCWKCKTAADFHKTAAANTTPSPTSITKGKRQKESNSVSRILFEIAVFILPMFLVFTDRYIYLVNGTLIGFGAYYRSKIPDQPRRDDKWAPSAYAAEYERTYIVNKVTPKPYLSIYRAEMMILTCFCILAVDFRIFPRSFAKVETFGTSIMDLGVGSFVFSAGVVGVKPFLPKISSDDNKNGNNNIPSSQLLARQLKSGLKSAFPLLILGIARFIVTEFVDYQKHVSEYGTHWNFFFTLGFLPIFVPFGLQLFNELRAASMILITVYQALYSLTPFGAWLENADRVGIISANREGIFSFTGYLAIFLMGMCLGKIILPDAKTLEDRRMRLVSVLGMWITDIIAFVLFYFVCDIDVSRRFANAPYCLWVTAFNTTMIWCFMVIEEDIDSKLPSKFARSSAPRSYYFPSIIQSTNFNGLTTFLIANLLTGVVNIAYDTLGASDIAAYSVLALYMAGILIPVLILYKFNIKIR